MKVNTVRKLEHTIMYKYIFFAIMRFCVLLYIPGDCRIASSPRKPSPQD